MAQMVLYHSILAHLMDYLLQQSREQLLDVILLRLPIQTAVQSVVQRIGLMLHYSQKNHLRVQAVQDCYALLDYLIYLPNSTLLGMVVWVSSIRMN